MRISELTGIQSQPVLEYLNKQYKQPREISVVPTEMGIGECVRVPKPLVEPVRDLVDSVKEIAKDSRSQGRGNYLRRSLLANMAYVDIDRIY